MNKATNRLKITFLGTGTSQGVPIINCHCPVCMSEDPRNKRLRTSISILTDHSALIIDTTPDLRQQLLKNPLSYLDGVLYTHAHADHIYGIDDLRRFNQLYNKRLPVYAAPKTLSRLTKIFDYAFGTGELNPGLPNLEGIEITGPFSINDALIQPIKLLHGRQEILGYRIGNVAYCTDVSCIPEESYSLLDNLEVLILGALRENSHPNHFSVDEAVAEALKIKAKQTYFIHMSHKIDHQSRQDALPPGMKFAYDGLILEAT
jgi:phosphoribosyl 1,2-cyclic phosphate phosphodiesterase